MRYFNRHFSLSSFKRLVGQDIFEMLRRFLPGRRERKIGVEGFIWLGLFVAANATLGSLKAIFSLVIGDSGGDIPPILVSVSAFCQYRARFPPQGFVALVEGVG